MPDFVEMALKYLSKENKCILFNSVSSGRWKTIVFIDSLLLIDSDFSISNISFLRGGRTMKRFVVCWVLSILLLPLFGCSPEEKQAAVSPTVLEAFAVQEEKAVEQLGLSNAMVDGSNHIYQGSSSWCGIEMDTEFVFKKEKPYVFTAEKVYDDSEKTRALAQECVALFKEQLGAPNACEFFNRETNNGISYGTYIEEGKEEEIEGEGFNTIFSDDPVIGYPLAFRFFFPSEDESMQKVFVECSFVRPKETPEQVTFTFQILPDITNPDYFE